jgi:hypothetical protein
MKSPWDIKKEDFPADGSLDEKIKFVLGFAILAPSTHNSQPWRFRIEGESCKIFYDPNFKIPEADPLGRDLYISMGCMIENLAIAANYFGIFKDLKIDPRDEFIGEIFFQQNGQRNNDLEYLIDAIPKRVNVRGLFDAKPLTGIQAQMLSLNKDGRIKMDFLTDPEKIKKLASVTAEGLRLAYKKSSFRREMSGWMNNNLSAKKTGLPGYSLRMPFLLSFIIPILVRFFDISPRLAKLNYKSMASAPFVCILSSGKSSPDVWLEVGRLAERVMLQLNSQGIRTSIFVASIEVGDLYKKVQEVTGINLVPQFLFCAGYMGDVQGHSPRQGIDKVLL